MDKSSDSKKRHNKLVQVIQNFFTKVLQLVIQSRTDQDPQTPKINKWFNLYMPSIDSESVRLECKPWRSHADLALFPPMIIETYLDLRQLDKSEMVMLDDGRGGVWPVADSAAKKLEIVLERWLIEFDRSASAHHTDELPLIYKQAIVLLRVIYTLARLLPCHKLLKTVGASKNLLLKTRVINGSQPVTSKGRIGLLKPIVGGTALHMTQRELGPIPSALGTLRVLVAYRHHHKFYTQGHEEHLLSRFSVLDKESRLEKERLEKESLEKERSEKEAKPRGSSFDSFTEKYSVLPCTSEHDIPRLRKLVGHAPRPSIQPFKVGLIGLSPPPGSVSVASGTPMERRISITSTRSGSNASLVALLRNPRGSISSTNTATTPTVTSPSAIGTAAMSRTISLSHGDEPDLSLTPRFLLSFGLRQSRRFSNTLVRFAVSNDAYLSESADLTSLAPFSGLYADDDISSFVQMIDGTSELRLSNFNSEARETPSNDSSAQFEAISRFQLLKSQYQQLSDSVNASLVLQQNPASSKSGSSSRVSGRRSLRLSPAPLLPRGSFDHNIPSIFQRLDTVERRDSADLGMKELKAGFFGARSALPRTETPKVVLGLATSPSIYQSVKQPITYEDVFDEEDDESSKPMDYDNDDLLFEMTDTR